MESSHLMGHFGQWIEPGMVVCLALALSYICIKLRPGKGEYLCGDCRFNGDGLCLKEGRPQVSVCTSYRQGPVPQTAQSLPSQETL